MRVLIAVDGSDGSFEAIRQIAPLLKEDRDEVAVYCYPPQVRVRSARAAPDMVDSARQALAETVFAEARRRLGTNLAVKAETIVGHQDPKRGINLAAQQWGAELIVLGARGLNVFERLLLGSVSRAVVHASQIPVWVAQAADRRAEPSAASAVGQRIAGCPAAASRAAGRLAWPESTSFTVMTVIASIFAGHVPQWLEQQARGPDVEAMVQAWSREHDEELRRARVA